MATSSTLLLGIEVKMHKAELELLEAKMMYASNETTALKELQKLVVAIRSKRADVEARRLRLERSEGKA